MKGLLITENDKINIKVALAQDKDGKLLCDVNKDMLLKTYGDIVQDETVEEHVVTFRRPTFKDNVDISSGVDLSGTEGDFRVRFNPLSLRYARFTSLIQSWTFKDEEGKDLPAIEENIKQLDPVVANIIGIQLDGEIGSF